MKPARGGTPARESMKYVDKGLFRLAGVGGNDDAFDEPVGVVFDECPVFESARLAHPSNSSGRSAHHDLD